MKPTLTELAIKFGSDKYYSHGYIPIYQRLFEGRDVKRLLEVGIGFEALMKDFTPRFVAGSSLLMWEEFFPTAHIYACDIRRDVLINEGRIHSTYCDQSSAESLEAMVKVFGGTFDCVVDDGSHVTEHQILTVKTLLPYVSYPGLFIIEDCYVDTGGQIINELHDNFYVKSAYLAVGAKRPDDTMVIIERGAPSTSL